jgi:hypothetical protein
MSTASGSRGQVENHQNFAYPGVEQIFPGGWYFSTELWCPVDLPAFDQPILGGYESGGPTSRDSWDMHKASCLCFHLALPLHIQVVLGFLKSHMYSPCFPQPGCHSSWQCLQLQVAHHLVGGQEIVLPMLFFLL